MESYRSITSFSPRISNNVENDPNICSKVEYSIAYTEHFQLC